MVPASLSNQLKHTSSVPSWGLTALLCKKVTKQLDFLCISGMVRLNKHRIAAVLIPFCITQSSSLFLLQCSVCNVCTEIFRATLKFKKNSVKRESSARDKQNSTYFVSSVSYCLILGRQRHQANKTLTLDTPWLRFILPEHLSKDLL